MLALKLRIPIIEIDFLYIGKQISYCECAMIRHIKHMKFLH